MSFSVRGHFDVGVSDTSWCDNTGPHITITSTISLGGFSLEMTFQNNVKGTHTYQVVGQAVLSLLDASGDSTPQIWKQPPLGGTGGNPFIYLQDPQGVNHYIGRCVQDGKIGQLNHGRWSADYSAAAWSTLGVQALSCTNKGSSLNVGTTSSTGDTTGKLIFSNSDLGLNPQHINDTDVAASFGILFAQGAKNVPKGGQLGGAGGNPLVSTDFGSGADAASFSAFGGTHTDHGRCNKLY